MTRQTLLKLGVGVAGGLALGGLSALDAGASLRRAAGQQAAEGVGTVHMLGWQGYDDPKARFMFTKAGGKLQTTYIFKQRPRSSRSSAAASWVSTTSSPSHAYLPRW